jgi:Predicted membrane protein (DUF2306)
MTTPNGRRSWLVPAALIGLSLVPVTAGALRLTEVASGAAVTPDNARFMAVPLPVVVHIIGASLYCVLGALQFAPGFRRRRIGWHRAAGRLLVPCGLAAALSGIWMTLFYDLPEHDGALLGVLRLGLGSAMALSIVLGFTAVLRRDITRHRAWMMRGYAIGQGAGTQALVIGPWIAFLGETDALSRAILMGAAWAINLAVAEWSIRRPTRVRASAQRGSDAPTGHPAA